MYKLFILIFLFSNALIAQNGIQYYNLANHPMYLENTFDVDMFKDALPYDYSIRLAYADTGAKTGYRVRISPSQTLREVMVLNDTMVKALNAGDIIDEFQTTWASNSLNYMELCYVGSTSYGEWQDVSNKFIGVKMFRNGDYHYGWVQMSILSGTTQPTVTVHDMAYQKTGGKGIKAGQTIGINDENPDIAKYILNNHLLQIQTLKPVNVSITDISGHQLTSTLIKTSKAIDLSAYPKGIYLLSITGDDGIMTKKIVLQ